jgi:hypothetical protein
MCLNRHNAVPGESIHMENPPPPSIDKARVLWWAWAGDEPFGLCSNIEVWGFAVCQYEPGAVYRFSCDRNWETVNDSLHDDEEDAKAAVPANYHAALARIRWHKYAVDQI